MRTWRPKRAARPSVMAPGQFSGLTYLDPPQMRPTLVLCSSFRTTEYGMVLFLLRNFTLTLLLVALVFSAGPKDSRWADDRRSAV
jgi:hypothetical protein